MKVVCLLSSGAGHLDLGGGGYLKTVLGLKNRGHEVVFITTDKQKERLEQYGIRSVVEPYINQLWNLEETSIVTSLKHEYFLILKRIELLVTSERPNVVLVDRILGLSEGLLNYLEIPFVTMGSPGGKWKKNLHSISNQVSMLNYNGLNQKLKEKLNWEIETVSYWCDSPFLNLTFIGKELYPNQVKSNTAIKLFSQNKYVKRRSQVAISIGSGSIHNPNFAHEVGEVLEKAFDLESIDLYGAAEYIGNFEEKLRQNLRIELRNSGFVKFDKLFKELTHLIFAGGIGTLWYCLEYGVWPIIISGNVHDQDYNASMLKTIGCGLDKLEQLKSEEVSGYLNCIKNDMTFDKTLDEAIEMIEKL